MPTGRLGIARAAGAAILVALVLQALLLAPSALGQGECKLSVAPATGHAGTTFVFSGSGFTPSKLDLSRDGGSATTLDLTLNNADPFQITIKARSGDEGRWTARAYTPGGCDAQVDFRVTLPSTATDNPTTTPGSSSSTTLLVAGMLIAAAVVGACGLRVVSRS